MNVFTYHELLADSLRLRIVNLLIEGPLCVCHFQDVLEIPQVKVSQQLAYLRKHGMVEVAPVSDEPTEDAWQLTRGLDNPDLA